MFDSDAIVEVKEDEVHKFLFLLFLQEEIMGFVVTN